jgi:hypothetical protein
MSPFNVQATGKGGRKMENKVKALLAAGALLAQLIFLSGCRSWAWALPEPIQQEHDKDVIFKVTWLGNQRPFSGYFMYMLLYTDGSVTRRLLHELGGEKGVFPGQLSKEQQEEIRTLLEAMTISSSRDPFAGSEVITLSFLWHGEHHVLSFSESSCPDELSRLFEITNMAWTVGDPFPNPCQRKSQPVLESAPSDNAPPPLLALPDPVKDVHFARLFQINWFERPFTGFYKTLAFVVEHRFYDNLITYREGEKNTSYGESTEVEKQEVQAILESLASTGSVEQPVGDTIITLGFSWEANYHLLVFGDENCPDDLRRLFEIADGAFLPRADEPDTFQSPCK